MGLSALALEAKHTVWDLGAGCGSVAIEASLLAHEGAVLAVERNGTRVQLIRDNIRRMGAYGVQAVAGEMPQCLAVPSGRRTASSWAAAWERTIGFWRWPP